MLTLTIHYLNICIGESSEAQVRVDEDDWRYEETDTVPPCSTTGSHVLTVRSPVTD